MGPRARDLARYAGECTGPSADAPGARFVLYLVVGVPQGAEWIMAKVNGLMNEKTAAKIRLHSGIGANEVRKALAAHLL